MGVGWICPTVGVYAHCGLYVDQPLKTRLAAYVRKFDVINRGLGGYQTDWAIPVFEQVIRRQRVCDRLDMDTL